MRVAVAGLLVAALVAALPSAAAARDVPADFQWGTAIAGFQTEMGRGRDLDRRTDWWNWTHDATNIARGTVTDDRPEDGPGFLARYRQDIDIAARDLNLDAFRLGLEWSRIFPRSTAGRDDPRRSSTGSPTSARSPTTARSSSASAPAA